MHLVATIMPSHLHTINIGVIKETNKCVSFVWGVGGRVAERMELGNTNPIFGINGKLNRF